MRYSVIPGGRIFFLSVFAVAGVAALAMIAWSVGSEEGTRDLVFTLCWLFALGWNAYWWLTRIAVELTVEDDVLRWRAPLTSGSVPLDTLTEVRPMRFGSSIEVFVRSGGRPVLVPVGKGLRTLLAELQRIRPDLPARLGWQGHFAESILGPSGFSREQ